MVSFITLASPGICGLGGQWVLLKIDGLSNGLGEWWTRRLYQGDFVCGVTDISRVVFTHVGSSLDVSNSGKAKLH